MESIWNRKSRRIHDLHAQSDTLLLADVFKNFRDTCIEIYGLDPTYFVAAPGLSWEVCLGMCIEIYGLDPTYFVSAPVLSWEVCLKKTEVKLELWTNYDMFLMVEKGRRGGICQTTHSFTKANNKYMKNYDKGTESSNIAYI